MISPGAYLALRRAAAGLSLNDVARSLLALPLSAPRLVAHPAGVERRRIRADLFTLESDMALLTPDHAAQLSQVFAFDWAVYQQLAAQHTLPAGGVDVWGLPIPRLCAACGCSWQDACRTPAGPCGWSEEDPSLCTACEAPVTPIHAAHTPSERNPAHV